MQIKSEVKFSKEDQSPGGPNPLELFLSSLGGCLGVYAKKYLARHAINFTSLVITVTAEFTSGAPARLKNIKARVGTDASLGDKRDIFLRFIENCPVHNTIVNTSKIDVILE